MPRFTRSICTAAILLASFTAWAGDWPAYRHDNNRSGATSEELAAKDLKPAWTYQSPVLPQPAWDAQARWDAYRKQGGIPATRNYDVAFQPIVVGQRLYFGSSSDDSIHCINTQTGAAEWTFTTNAPIRIAPAFYKGNLYFGSDDGHAYCIDAATGKQVWDRQPEKPVRLVLNDGRFVSPWACRGGVVIVEDPDGRATAYFTSSFLTWEPTILCAVDAATGSPEGKGRYITRGGIGRHFDGPIAAFDNYLYCPQGNTGPGIYNRGDGTSFGGIWAAQGGFSFVYIPEEKRIVVGGMDYKGYTGLMDSPLVGNGAYVMGAISAAYKDRVLYYMNGGNIYGMTRPAGPKTMDVGGGPFYCVIIAGNTVFAGGEDKIKAFSTKGEALWEAPVNGQVYGLAVADGALFASTDLGQITCFRADGKLVTPAAPPATPVAKLAQPKPAVLTAGPFARFTDATHAEITWWTPKPSPTILLYANGTKIVRDDKPKTEHHAIMDGLVPHRPANYQIRTVIDGAEAETGGYAIDTYFNYSIPTMPKPATAFADNKTAEQTAANLLKTSSAEPGLCLVIGAADKGQLAYEIAKQSQLRVLIVEKDRTRIDAAREALLKTGAYGAIVSVLPVDNYAQLPLPTGAFVLIAAPDPALVADVAELCRLLRPLRGVAMLKDATAATLAGSPIKPTTSKDWAVIRRTEPFPGSKPWTHQYALPSNSTCGDEMLQGATGFSQLTVQWVGRPGPRYQADRENRKPAPLAANGRLFMQGQETLFAVDTQTGTVLWSLLVPGLLRLNMPRDASNYCTDGDYVYLALRDKCWQVDAATGKVVKMLDVVPRPERDYPFDWSYIATENGLLLGTGTTQGSAWTLWWGSAAWYEHGGWEKVCSDTVFAYDKTTGKLKWKYCNGVIINTTITVADGRVYFIETREPAAVTGRGRILNGGELWNKPLLVGLDLKTGKKVFERQFQPGQIAAGNNMFSMAYGSGKLVICSNSGGKGGGTFFIYGLNAKDGSDAWKQQLPWPGYGHGAQMSRPVIVGQTLYIAPHVMDITTGKVSDLKCPKGACGTAGASHGAIIYRSGVVNFWDVNTHVNTIWPSVRPDCWLSTVPAEGLVLEPEGGGGCVCAAWLETSAALAPRTDFAFFTTPPRNFITSLKVTLDPPVGGGILHYTTDGSNPAAQSPQYKAPIEITKTSDVKAAVTGAPCGPKIGPVITRQFVRLEGKLLTEGKVNFQPSTIAARPAGFLIDTGKSVSIQDNGCAYGWETDMGIGSTDPAKLTDPIKQTFVGLGANNAWEIAVPNGVYTVTTCVGHVEGETKKDGAGSWFVCDAEFALEKDLAKGELAQIARKVRVTDGKLRLCKKDKNILIEYVEFKKD